MVTHKLSQLLENLGGRSAHPYWYGRERTPKASRKSRSNVPMLLFTVSIPQWEQTLSPKAEGLFQRAIFQSGVATVGSYTIKNPLPQAKVGGLRQPVLASSPTCLLAPDHRQPDGM